MIHYKIIGLTLVVGSCGALGFQTAAAYKKEILGVRQFIRALEYMRCELQYRLTALPELCRQASRESKGVIRSVFHHLSYELENQISPNITCCMNAALGAVHNIPRITKTCFTLLGESLGRFDLQGQLISLESLQQYCTGKLTELEKDRTMRLRSYKTLGLCVGAALAIFLI